MIDFERAFSSYVGCLYGVGVNSGTDALALGLRALGVGPGDEVIIPALTASATATAVLLVGATPVVVDVRSEHPVMDPMQCELALSQATKAIIAVHLYGRAAPLAELREMANDKGIYLIEDAAQAHGGLFQGRPLGSIGDLAAFSFYPTKNLGAVGDAGMVTTNRREVAERIFHLRQYGWSKRNYSEFEGINSRLDELQAAILLQKLPYLEGWVHERRQVARRYCETLAHYSTEVGSPADLDEHSVHKFIVLSNERDRLQDNLTEHGVGSGVYYPYTISQQPAFQRVSRIVGTHTNAERWATQGLAIPVFAGMREWEIEHVCSVLRSTPSEATPRRGYSSN